MPYSLDKAVRDDSVTITLFPQEKARALILALRIGRMSGRVEETRPYTFRCRQELSYECSSRTAEF
jgi:hypothetical protein